MAHSKLSNVCFFPAIITSNDLSYSLPQTSHCAISVLRFQFSEADLESVKRTLKMNERDGPAGGLDLQIDVPVVVLRLVNAQRQIDHVPHVRSVRRTCHDLDAA